MNNIQMYFIVMVLKLLIKFIIIQFQIVKISNQLLNFMIDSSLYNEINATNEYLDTIDLNTYNKLIWGILYASISYCPIKKIETWKCGRKCEGSSFFIKNIYLS